MKALFLILACISVCTLCLTVKKKLKMKMESTDSRDDSYGIAILNEINSYRHLHLYGENDEEIKWSKTLSQEAKDEAEKIKSKNDFGAHTRFSKYNKKYDAAYLTEFSVNIPVEKLPNSKSFAIMTLESILKDQEFDIMHQYTHGGIAMVKNSKGYLVVLHFIKKIGTYKSCQEAMEKGDKSDQIFIKRNGKKEILNCDQVTQGGGWSMILDCNKIIKAEPLHVPIDDRDLKFKQMLIRVKDNFYVSYNKRKLNSWEMDGMMYRFFKFKFGDTYYTEYNTYKGGSHGKMVYYKLDTDVQLLKKGKKCYWGGRNYIRLCGREFIITKVPAGKLTELTELHTVQNAYIEYDYFDLFFWIYVR